MTEQQPAERTYRYRVEPNGGCPLGGKEGEPPGTTGYLLVRQVWKDGRWYSIPALTEWYATEEQASRAAARRAGEGDGRG